jgi:hypothetical protein
MAIFRNPCLRQASRRQSAGGGQVCGIACATYQMHVSAQSLDFLDLANPTSAGLDWKLTPVLITKRLIHGWALASFHSCCPQFI